MGTYGRFLFLRFSRHSRSHSVCPWFRSYNTFFGVNFTDPLEEMDDRWRFFGTSASAPNVAAVALLVLQAVPDLPPSRVYEILEATAIDMNQVGFDYDSGHGFVNALAAVEMALSEAGGMGDDDGDDDGKKKKQKKTKDEDGSDVSTPSQCSFTFGDVDVEILMGDAALETRSHGGKKKLKSN
jgi:Subtilase family